MPSFLIVKTSAIGDVIQTFPVLEYLRKNHPDSRIDWVVEKGCYDLLSSHPEISHVYPVDTKRWRKELFHPKTWKELFELKRTLSRTKYDAVFDLQSNSKSALFTLFARAKHKVGFGFRTVHERLNYLTTNMRYDVPKAMNVRLRYLQLVQQYFEENSPFTPQGVSLQINEEEKARLEKILSSPSLQTTPRIMVAFGSKWRNKQLSSPTLIGFLTLLRKELGCGFLFIFGSEEERLIAEELKAEFLECSETVGKMSLPLWQQLMSRVEAVIAMDSAALHLCGTTKTPSFGVFGPSSAPVFHPGGRHHAYQGSCPYGRTFEKQCPILRTCPTGSCIRDLKPEQLFDSFMSWWKESSLKD